MCKNWAGSKDLSGRCTFMDFLISNQYAHTAYSDSCSYFAKRDDVEEAEVHALEVDLDINGRGQVGLCSKCENWNPNRGNCRISRRSTIPAEAGCSAFFTQSTPSEAEGGSIACVG